MGRMNDTFAPSGLHTAFGRSEYVSEADTSEMASLNSKNKCSEGEESYN
jgi:hypothetical protein